MVIVNMKKNNKKIKYTIIIIIIIIIVLMICTYYLLKTNPVNIEKNQLEYILNDDDWKSDTIYPDGTAAFGRTYNGELTVKDIGKSMYYVTTQVFPNYYIKFKDSSKETIEKYFDSNKNLIAMQLGIEKKAEFVDVINKLQKLDVETLKLDTFYLNIKKIEIKDNYTNVDLHITYADCKEIVFNMSVNKNKTYDKSPIIYS